MPLSLPHANWPSKQAHLRVVQLVLGDSKQGEPYLVFEDSLKSGATHDEILRDALKARGIMYATEKSRAPMFENYEIPRRTGEGYICPGMGFARIVRPQVINFQGHSSHYALGVNLPHLAQIAQHEPSWSILYNGIPLY